MRDKEKKEFIKLLEQEIKIGRGEYKRWSDRYNECHDDLDSKREAKENSCFWKGYEECVNDVMRFLQDCHGYVRERKANGRAKARTE